MKDEENEHEDGLTPVYKIPRLHADFCRMVCTDREDEDLAHAELYLDSIYKIIHERVEELADSEDDFEDSEMCVSFELTDAKLEIKQIVLGRLMDSGFDCFTAVDTEEEAEYLRDLESLSEYDDAVREAMEDYQESANKFIIYW